MEIVGGNVGQGQGFIQLRQFLGAFEKLPDTTLSFVMSVCPYVRNNSDTTGRIFLKFHI